MAFEGMYKVKFLPSLAMSKISIPITGARPNTRSIPGLRITMIPPTLV